MDLFQKVPLKSSNLKFLLVCASFLVFFLVSKCKKYKFFTNFKKTPLSDLGQSLSKSKCILEDGTCWQIFGDIFSPLRQLCYGFQTFGLFIEAPCFSILWKEKDTSNFNKRLFQFLPNSCHLSESNRIEPVNMGYHFIIVSFSKFCKSMILFFIWILWLSRSIFASLCIWPNHQILHPSPLSDTKTQF